MATETGVSLNDRRTVLYRFYDADDVLLYVGISVDPKTRDYQHARQSVWWPKAARKEVCWYDTWIEADAAEKAAIVAERPLYNIAGACDPVTLPHPPRPLRPALSPSTKTRLRAAAEAARRAPDDLLNAMVEAAKDGATNLDIAKEIDFFYNPDYVGKLVNKRVGNRPPGRRPRRDDS